MDVSSILADHASKYQSTTVEDDALELDTGFLTVTNNSVIDEESYNEDLEEYLTSTTRSGVQALIASLFSLPTKPSPDGPLAQLPPPTTMLPRTKSLPKEKPQTKWERFAAAKGISHRKKERREWDEERQEWVNRWGKDGKNRQKEDQWIHEVPANAPADFEPTLEARKERKAKVAKNEKQKLANEARAAGSNTSQDRRQRKHEIEKTLATTRTSTASMGKFDKRLEGEKKLRGVKRKFEAAERSEKDSAIDLIKKIDRGEGSVLNVRKAIRSASGGSGGVALGKSRSGIVGRGGGSGGKGAKRRK